MSHSMWEQARNIEDVVDGADTAPRRVMPLEPVYKRFGYTFRQVDRGEHWAIYAQFWDDGSQVPCAYETIRVRIAPPFTTPKGQEYPEREVYPPTEKWGFDGWTYSTLAGGAADALNLARGRAAKVHAEAERALHATPRQ